MGRGGGGGRERGGGVLARLAPLPLVRCPRGAAVFRAVVVMVVLLFSLPLGFDVFGLLAIVYRSRISEPPVSALVLLAGTATRRVNNNNNKTTNKHVHTITCTCTCMYCTTVERWHFNDHIKPCFTTYTYSHTQLQCIYMYVQGTTQYQGQKAPF